MPSSPQPAYSNALLPAQSPRQVEYTIIAKVTQELLAAKLRPDTSRHNILKALNRNDRLWSSLAADVALPENPLPALLRAQILYLYRFTLQQSQKIRNRGAEIDVLIDINTAILRGLRGKGAAQ